MKTLTRIGRITMTKVLRAKCSRVLKCSFVLFFLIFVIDISGVFRHIQEKSFRTDFSYPLETPNFINLVNNFRLGNTVAIPPINNLYSSILIHSDTDTTDKCSNEDNPLSLLVLVKSAPANQKNRNAIRETWKVSTLENNGKLMFFIGNPNPQNSPKNLATTINLEASTHEDIVLLDFQDSYYNNTIKTMLEMRWAVEKCPNFAYALLVDDDYYVSIKKLQRFLENPINYPTDNLPPEDKAREVEKLYAGYRMFPPPHRHKIFTKWFVELDEYPYDYFPPYITAGAIVLSKAALLDIYYASFYVTHFRFDDVYVAICAKKMNITPLNSEYFRFWTTEDDSPEEHLVASHGFSNPNRLTRFWSSQKSHGYC